MTPPEADAVFTLFAEDVRQETSGRMSFMGVYGPTLEVDTLPALIPSLCVTLLVRNPRQPINSISVIATAPNGTRIMKGTTATPSLFPEPHMAAHTAKVFPVLLDCEGDFRVVFQFNGSPNIGVEASIRVKRKPAPASQAK